MENDQQLWWKKPLRVIQTNLQVLDTPKMDPIQLAEQMDEMGANVLVMNVGGIYAWYPSKVKYHYINEYLPSKFDLLERIIEECHKKSIRVVARFDFSKADDSVYQNKPQWFVRDSKGEPQIIGSKRPGKWSLLVSTCINGGYRNEGVAMPVFSEVLDNYDIDGIFFNAPNPIPCNCDECKRKYRDVYGKELPIDAAQYESDWGTRCMRDNIGKLYKLMKEKKPDMPLILYYNLYKDNLFDRVATADMLCTEPQDVLSLGYKNIPQFWKPALAIKLGRSMQDRPSPFGIIHSCPGMDWRHTGLPPAEHLFWMSQIPANGGYIWHSITGFPDTIGDKRIIKSVSQINHMIKKAENQMFGAFSVAQVALIWNADRSAEGWAEGLINKQVPFEVLLDEQATIKRLADFRVVIIPEGFKYNRKFITNIIEYVQQGGNIVVEGSVPEEWSELYELIGIKKRVYHSESLVASYLRFEGENNPLQLGMEETPIIAHRGIVTYCEALIGTKVLATLVPPFSPLESVGAPPERSSIPVPYTDIPLCVMNQYGKGSSVYIPFQLSLLIQDYKLDEHYRFLENVINLLLGDNKKISVTHFNGLQLVVYEKDNTILVHLVNGVGQRPLSNCTPLHDIKIKLALKDGMNVSKVTALIDEKCVKFEQKNSYVECTIDRLDVWEVVSVEMESSNK
ncbi:MAG TPA: hypothetical protein VIK72_00630 [Clostridiaceae bacterium]